MIKAYRRFAPWAAVLAAAASMPAPLWAQVPQYDGPHMWGAGWHGWFFGSIMMAVFFTALIALIVVLAWRAGGGMHAHTPHLPPAKTPVDILKERFARGESSSCEVPAALREPYFSIGIQISTPPVPVFGSNSGP